ncbi:Heavy metal-associated domain superfamily [Arabidopsis suecica]|uniref:Heavy metal-associated domain superfamily n=1 Tax=Arabidopsis suecica TaxID=45249 RepID=A0A8T1ZUI4_ARASU|nr:Heavy metal-associated domain superfamily [Arabidopsis suecica]
MSEKKQCCVVMRINLDCNACCRKARRIIINMKEVDTHMINKKERQVILCGRFRPSDVAVKLQKKMKRRVEILEVEDLANGHGGEEGHEYEPPYEQPYEYSQQSDHMTTPLLC